MFCQGCDSDKKKSELILAIIIAFLTQEALDGFRVIWGWEAGVDGNVALITIGAGERVDTRTIKDPIVGFVFDVKGLHVPNFTWISITIFLLYLWNTILV